MIVKQLMNSIIIEVYVQFNYRPLWRINVNYLPFF